MNKIKFSLVSFLATLFVASTAYATECAVDTDCPAGEVCIPSATGVCPPCSEGSACDPCVGPLVCVPDEAPTDCASGSGSSEGSAADCGSGEPAGSGSGVAEEVDTTVGSGSGADTGLDTAPPWGDGSGAAGAADKSKSDSGCSAVPTAAGIFGIFAMIGTLLFLRRKGNI